MADRTGGRLAHPADPLLRRPRPVAAVPADVADRPRANTSDAVLHLASFYGSIDWVGDGAADSRPLPTSLRRGGATRCSGSECSPFHQVGAGIRRHSVTGIAPATSFGSYDTAWHAAGALGVLAAVMSYLIQRRPSHCRSAEPRPGSAPRRRSADPAPERSSRHHRLDDDDRRHPAVDP